MQLWMWWPICGMIFTGLLLAKSGIFQLKYLDWCAVGILVTLVCGSMAGPLAVIAWFLV